MKRIVVTGPESSGKTTLASALAAALGTAWVPEQSRPYLEQLNRPYKEHDLRAIGEQQLHMEDEMAEALEMMRTPFLICDTDLITIRIWGQEKYGRSDPWVQATTAERPYALWLLCTPDMPWEPDPLRENPHDRDRLFTVYEQTLQQLNKPYAIMRGPHEQRLQQALQAIRDL